MENIEQKTGLVQGSNSNKNETEEVFQPTGAIAFFVLLILLSLATWYGIYLLMLQRV